MRDDAPLVWERIQVHHFKDLSHCLRHWVILLSLSLTARSMFFSGKPCHAMKASFGKLQFYIAGRLFRWSDVHQTLYSLMTCC